MRENKKMRRLGTVIIVLELIALVVLLCGCNRQIVDLTYKFDSVMIKMPDGTTVVGRVESWKDFDDGDQIQVRVNGRTYLTHMSNVVLITN